MYVFPIGSEEMHAYIAEMLHRMFSYDAMFESMRILETSKGSDDLYAHKVET
jgi:hypothetical protein